MTRTEKGNDLFLTDPFNIAETLEDAISMHRDEASRRGLSLDVVENPSGTPPTVLGDRAKIRQIVTNVVANALKHTDEGGIHIEWGEAIDENLDDALAAKKDGIRIGISISDTGHGITEQKLENIFRQLENVSTIGDRERDEHADEEKAVGLGLAVVARIVRNLDGQLQVESKVGKGSKFTFIFPFRLPPPEAAPSAEVIAADGETETERTSQVPEGGASLSRRMSTKSTGSNGSRASRASSEIDSLIQAISTNHMRDSPPASRPATASGRSIGSRSTGRSIGSRSTGSAQSSRSFRTAATSHAVKSQRDDNGSVPGQVEIRNSATPLRASRVPDPSTSPLSSPRLGSASATGPSFNNPFFPAGFTARNGSANSATSGESLPADVRRRKSSLSQASTAPSGTDEMVTPRPSSPLHDTGISTREEGQASQPADPARSRQYAGEDSIEPMRVLVVEDEVGERVSRLFRSSYRADSPHAPDGEPHDNLAATQKGRSRGRGRRAWRCRGPQVRGGPQFRRRPHGPADVRSCALLCHNAVLT